MCSLGGLGKLLPFLSRGEASWSLVKPESDLRDLVSVVGPSFNQGCFIEETILSVKNLDFSNIVEAIVGEGGFVVADVYYALSHLYYWERFRTCFGYSAYVHTKDLDRVEAQCAPFLKRVIKQ